MDEEKSITDPLTRFGDTPPDAEQGGENRREMARIFGGSGAGLSNSDIASRFASSGIINQAVDDFKENWYSRLQPATELEQLMARTVGGAEAQAKGYTKQAARVVATTAKDVVDSAIQNFKNHASQMELMTEIEAGLGAIADGMSSNSGAILRGIADTAMDSFKQHTSTQNLSMDIMAGIDSIGGMVAGSSSDIIEGFRQSAGNQTTMIDMMRSLKNSFGASGADMLQPGSSLLSASEMMGFGREEKVLDSDDQSDNSLEDFIGALVASGVSREDAMETADAVDVNKDGSISEREMQTGSTNIVADKAMRDPRFRARLIKQRPFSSIYGPDNWAKYNQTEMVDTAMALDASEFNAENVAFST